MVVVIGGLSTKSNLRFHYFHYILAGRKNLFGNKLVEHLIIKLLVFPNSISMYMLYIHLCAFMWKPFYIIFSSLKINSMIVQHHFHCISFLCQLYYASSYYIIHST